MHLVLMIAGGILLAILVLPLLGIAIPIAITIGLCAGILFSFAFLAFFIRDTIQERKETKERLSKMSEEDRAAEIEKMKVKKKTTIMAWIITGILIIVPFLLAQIMAFLLTYNYNKSNFSGPNSQINEQEQSRPIPSVLIEMYGKY